MFRKCLDQKKKNKENLTKNFLWEERMNDMIQNKTKQNKRI